MRYTMKVISVPKRNVIDGKRTKERVDYQVMEAVFPAKQDSKTLYFVTMAAVVVHADSTIFWGASACSPYDFNAGLFDMGKGQAMAIGRAHQAMHKFYASGHRIPTLCGKASFMVHGELKFEVLKELAFSRVAGVAANAFARFIAKEQAHLDKWLKRGYGQYGRPTKVKRSPMPAISASLQPSRPVASSTSNCADSEY